MKDMFILNFIGGKKEYLAHSFFSSADQVGLNKKLETLHMLYKNKRVSLQCCCSLPKPQMSIGKRTNYYVSSFRDQAKLHSADCLFSRGSNSSLSASTSYQKGITEKDGKLHVSFNHYDYQKTEIEEKQESSTSISPVLPKKQGNADSRQTHDLSINAFLKRLTTEAWNNAIQYAGKFNYPTHDLVAVYKQLTEFILKKYVHAGFPFTDIIYKGEAEGKVAVIEKKVNGKTAAFTVLLLEKQGILQNESIVQLSVKNPLKNQYRKLNVPPILFESAMKNGKSISNLYVIGGFLIAKGYGETPEFISFGAVPITDYGTPVESSFEHTFYTMIADEKRKVIRPFIQYEDAAWNGFIPDGLLIDTKPKTIVEIFGMSEDMIDYHERKAIKSQLFQSLQPKYDFWSWDAFQNLQIPPLPSSKYTK